jgi:hypothetical protein
LGGEAALDKGRTRRQDKRIRMAAEGNTPEDFKAHFKSYSSFATMMKWGTILSFITGMVVVVIISS